MGKNKRGQRGGLTNDFKQKYTYFGENLYEKFFLLQDKHNGRPIRDGAIKNVPHKLYVLKNRSILFNDIAGLT